MKLSYFDDTDTLYIEFTDAGIFASKDLDEDTLIDLDAQGRVCAMTFEHANERADLSHLTVEGLAA